MACTGSEYTSFNHTLFLGLSISSVATTIGFGEQVSELTVRLYQDACVAPSEKPKHYWDTDLNHQTTTAADPGFIGEVIDIIGMPCYFRLGDFEFCGLIQSWEKSNSTSGYPAYTVKIVSPINILQNTHLILDGYSGPILPGNNLFSVAPNNLINVFGFLEGFNGITAPELYQDEPGVYLPGDAGIDGAVFGTSAGGFGGSLKNANGIQWTLIQSALSVLLSATPPLQNSWSPHGRLTHRGIALSTIGSPWTNGYGLLTNDGVINNRYISEYILDLSDLPTPPSSFRFSGSDANLLELLTRVCNECGFDYYVELLPVKNSFLSSSGIGKMIKVRVINRSTQPSLDGIPTFIGTVQSANRLVSSTLGTEFRDDVTSAFLFGGAKESVYQIDQNDNPDGLSQSELSSLSPNGELDVIVPFVGRDSFGNMIVPHRDGNDWSYWYADFETENLNSQLGLIDFSGIDLRISNRELEAAANSIEQWRNHIDTNFSYVAPTSLTTISTSGIIAQFNPTSGETKISNSWRKLKDKIEAVNQNRIQHGLVGRDMLVSAKEVDAFSREGNTLFDNINSVYEQDQNIIYEFVNNIAQRYLGKTWAVRVPAVYGFLDPESNTPFFSDEPGQNGGWTEMPKVIGLDNPSFDLSLFTDDKNKIGPITRFSHSNLLTDFLFDNVVSNASGLYFRSDLAPDYTYHDWTNLYIPRAVISIELPITQALDGIYEQIGGWDRVFTLMNLSTGIRQDLFSHMGTTIGEKSAFYRAYVIGDVPLSVAFPIKSNIHTYGPWSVVGAAGGIKIEQNDGLVPWEFGGYDAMNLAGQQLVDFGLTNTQVVEAGSVTVAGPPDLPLGVEINSASILGGQHLIENRFVNFQTLNGDFNGSPVNYTYPVLQNFNWNGTYGPNITNVNINIGEGVTTTYEMRTFTPRFGRFSELNANRLRQVGQNRLKLLKWINTININNEKGVIAKGQKTQLAQRIPDLQHRWERARQKYKSLTPHEFLVGEIFKPSVNTGISGLYTGEILPRTLVGTYSNHDIDAALAYYEKKAYMSMDGLIRPISLAGDGGLPRYISPSGSGSASTTQTYVISTGLQIVATGSGTNSLITVRELNPFSNPAGYAWSELASRHTGTMGHDIDVLGRGSDFPDNGLVLPGGTGTDYRDDYRPFGLRGPLLVHGWGYDTEGKPVPNQADTELGASGGLFKTSGLSDNFLADWLAKPHTWPVAPVDLRLDRGRGVWTLANSEPEKYCELLGHLGKGHPALARILDTGTYFTGISGQITGYQAISGFTQTENIYASGCKLVFKYDSTLSRWEPKSDSEVTVLLTGTISGAIWDRNITGMKPYRFSAPSFGIHTGISGWLVYQTGNMVTGWNRYPDTVDPGDGQAYIAKIGNGWLDNGSCRSVTL